MKFNEKILDNFRVRPGKKLRLKDHDPGWQGDGDLSKKERREFAEGVLQQGVRELAEAQKLYAADSLVGARDLSSDGCRGQR